MGFETACNVSKTLKRDDEWLGIGYGLRNFVRLFGDEKAIELPEGLASDSTSASCQKHRRIQILTIPPWAACKNLLNIF